MSNDAKTLDLAERIAKAISRTDMPDKPIFTSKEDVETSYVGETPFHLRHLVNLLSELRQEKEFAQNEHDCAKAKLDKVTSRKKSPKGLILSMRWLVQSTEADLGEAITAYDIVYSLIFTSLQKHLPNMELYGRVCIRDNWSVQAEVTKTEGVIVENA